MGIHEYALLLLGIACLIMSLSIISLSSFLQSSHKREQEWKVIAEKFENINKKNEQTAYDAITMLKSCMEK